MIVFDTEATGFLPIHGSPLSEYPHLVEFAGIKLDDNLNELERLEFLCKPSIPLPEIFTKVTGITEADVENAPPFSAFVWRLSKFFLGYETMVAHNVMYDEMVLEAALKRINAERRFPWPSIHICTVEATTGMEGERKGNSGRFNLAELHLTLTGEKLEKAHRAINDVEGLVRCVRILRERDLI